MSRDPRVLSSVSELESALHLAIAAVGRLKESLEVGPQPVEVPDGFDILEEGQLRRHAGAYGPGDPAPRTAPIAFADPPPEGS